MIPLEVREKTWDVICDEILSKIEDINQRAIIVQIYIAQSGPVPNSRGEKVRAMLKPRSSI